MFLCILGFGSITVWQSHY